METKKIAAITHYLSVNDVKYCDVQAELIDHFASAIEKVQRENPEVGFKEALIKAHRSFGGREGFRKYMVAAEKRVENKTLRLLGNTLLHYLSWPYFVLTAAVYLLWYVLLPLFVDFSYLSGGFILALLTVLCINLYRVKDSSFYLPKRANNVIGLIYNALYYPLLWPFLFGKAEGFVFPWMNALVFTLLSMVLVSCFRLPVLSQQEVEKIYPKPV